MIGISSYKKQVLDILIGYLYNISVVMNPLLCCTYIIETEERDDLTMEQIRILLYADIGYWKRFMESSSY